MAEDDIRGSLIDGKVTSEYGSQEQAKDGKFNKLFWAVSMLFSGTLTTIFAKSLFETSAKGSDYCNLDDDVDKYCTFNKPWFTVLVMKLAMTMCLLFYYVFGWGNNPNTPRPSWSTIKAVLLPASLDLLNTTLGNVGLLWVNSSIYQMTRGSVVIFSAFLSVKYLHRTLRSFHYWSIFFVLIAVILVGLAGIETSDSGSGGSQVIIGLMFILMAQLVTALQFIVEEKLMNDAKTTLDPVALVGFEGLWGLLMFAVLAPILTYTPRSSEDLSIVWHEDFGDTFVQLSNSSALCGLTFGYFCAILMYNVAANFVTQCLSAVVRSILEACRVMGVWIVCLGFFYTVHNDTIGEKWSNWSYLELFGFSILMYGTFCYKGLLKIPWVDPYVYELAENDAKEAEALNRGEATAYDNLSTNDSNI